MAYLDVSGSWRILQSNGFNIVVSVRQHGPDLTVSCLYVVDTPKALGIIPMGSDIISSMEARGTVTDREFHLAVSWKNGTRGIYRGVVDSDGNMTGTTYDEQNRRGGRPVATWRADRAFGLVRTPASPKKSPIKAVGRRSPRATDATQKHASRLSTDATQKHASRLSADATHKPASWLLDTAARPIRKPDKS